MTKEKEVSCMYCARQLPIPSSVDNKLAFEATEKNRYFCIQCAKSFAADESSCFGKQDQKTGKPLAANPACKTCSCYKPCANWPKNPVVFVEPPEEGETAVDSKEKEPKATPPETKGKGKKKTSATKSSGKAATSAGAGKKAAAAKKTTGKKSAAKSNTPPATKSSAEVIDYGEGARFRKGSSLEVACGILTKRKSISQDEAIKLLEKSGVESSNYPARIDAAAKILKKAGVLESNSTDKGIIYSTTK